MYVSKHGTVAGGPPELVRRLLCQGATSYALRSRHAEPRQGLGRKARVLAVVHGWMPSLAAGSERMMQHLLDALPRTEFEVAVLSFGIGGNHQDGEYYEYEGIPVFVGFGVPFPPDIIITHHGFAARVVQDICQEWP